MNHFRKEGVFLLLARRTVNQANYNRNQILVLKILLPTHQEQREKADTIRVVDAKIRHHHTKEREGRRSFPNFVAPVDDGSLGRTRTYNLPQKKRRSKLLY
jgi:restriction endonuclease S subunit